MRNGPASPSCPAAGAAFASEARCPYCHHPEHAGWAEARDEENALHHVLECLSCRTAYLWPPPTEAQLAAAYGRGYYGEGSGKFHPVFEQVRDVFARLRVRTLARGLPLSAKILDVGCGDGRLLRQFQKSGYHDLHGIELPGAAADRAAEISGIELCVGSLESAEFPDASFDLITLVHVFEHLAAPCETLDKIARLTKRGGRLFLSFPNISSRQAKFARGRWFHLDSPRHLALVPPRVVILHLQRLGFALRSEKHFCPEQNIYGWIQSVLNLCDHRRNFLYERMKQNRGYLPERGPASLALHAAMAGLLLVPALIMETAAALAKAGGTVDLMFEKS